MSLLFILNDALYGSEKLYNALRLAMKLQQEHADAEILIFLMADAVTGALLNQSTPQGYYNVGCLRRSSTKEHRSRFAEPAPKGEGFTISV